MYMHDIDKYSQHKLAIWSVWVTGSVFVYNLNGCGFKSCFSHLNFRYRACSSKHSSIFSQGLDVINKSAAPLIIELLVITCHENLLVHLL